MLWKKSPIDWPIKIRQSSFIIQSAVDGESNLLDQKRAEQTKRFKNYAMESDKTLTDDEGIPFAEFATKRTTTTRKLRKIRGHDNNTTVLTREK